MQQPNRNRNPFRNTFMYLIVGLAILGIVSLLTNGSSIMSNSRKITSTEFITQLENNEIAEFEVQIGSGVYHVRGEYENETVTEESDEELVQIFQGSPNATSFETEILGNDATLERVTGLADKTETKFKAIPESSAGVWLSFVPVLLMLIPALFLMYTMMQSANGGGKGVMNFGKSKSKDVSKQKVKIRFSDVAGAEEEKQELVEIVEFLKDPKKFTALGARIPAGVLLEGPPGTGKTLLAKAVAGEAGVPFFSISGSEFVEMFVGVGASRVRDLFENAKKNAPSIIFIDEIDAVGRQRGAGMGGGHDEREQTLNQLLVEMDGFEGNEGVIVMAATNRSDVLDPALLRPGRFDRQILVGNPDVKGREAILRVHARNKKLAKNVDLKVIAQQTPGFSGADLENLLNEAALIAARYDRKEIMEEDVDEAHDRVIAGPAKKDAVISDKQRRTVAYHEAGHTVIGMVLSEARTVHKVTIVPRGRAGGYAIMLPKEDQYIVTSKELFEQVVGLLGGRAAEEIVFGHQSTGASNDFQQATSIVRSMVTKYGMSDKIGTVQYEGESQPFAGRQYGAGNQIAYSEQIAYDIDTEIHRIMEEAHQEAHQIINEHREQLNRIAEKLLEIETLDARQIKSLFETGEMPVEEPDDQEEIEKADSFEEAKEKAENEDDSSNLEADKHETTQNNEQ
ncbi:ATP-dependent metallopeptidase FtsH/Yme1/Tma family protein [Facklamia sp. DSM 111018]|uniref:ATP-dependent zinc metalloprotease FtsH n=1 Tax=Facklamia lactis TaxID=2749967 RepID=A0ABS0LR54_9LACT|nr:ATP-dependent zinc metalloprotease FtsH [Facklamia lactis]MBG9980670.1 ATP-dependent metallopeptidase FtsH/Yme1/Tma family protein [Facklamia lactis]MBG9986484.1 ATP-dependent metallopeptidase FtsH/Yme1/Tma family protein [Facklamia lactis]